MPVNCAIVGIACDTFLQLYVNEKLIESGKDWYRDDCYTVRFETTRLPLLLAKNLLDCAWKMELSLRK